MKIKSEDFIHEICTRIDRSVVSDEIDGTVESLNPFSNFWHTSNENKDFEKRFKVPSDLFFSGTIPIMDMKINIHNDVSSEDCVVGRVVIFEPEDVIKTRGKINGLYDGKSSAMEWAENITYKNVFIIGVVMAWVKSNPAIDNICMIIPISICEGDNSISVGNVCIFRDSNNKKNAFLRPINNTECENKFIFDIVSIILPVWYGIELALLHPIVIELFKRPKRIKRDRKELIDMYKIVPEKRRSKYVRRHVIESNNCIDKIVNDTIYLEKGEKEMKKYERHTMIWRVIGHWRQLDDERKTFINPYWKGPLRDMPGFASTNKRDVDINYEEFGWRKEWFLPISKAQ